MQVLSETQSVQSEVVTERQFLVILRYLLRKPSAIIGFLALILLTLACIMAPHLTPYEQAKLSPRSALQPPSLEHPLGTDHFGRDQLTRILYGGRISLRVSVVAMIIGATFGILLGASAGYWPGWIDEAISRFIDVMLAFPNILLAMVVITLLGTGVNNLMIALGVAMVPGFARLSRGTVISVRENDYVLAARALGGASPRVIVRHILPNAAAPLIVYCTLEIGVAILASAGLNFLGLGADPPTPEWGLMLAESRIYIRRAWWLATFPGVAIMVMVISINVFGDGLRDALDPWLKGR